MELIVTLDHFFQNWETSQGSLWLCVQPHVQAADADQAVTDWIKNYSLDGSGLTYKAASLSDTMGMTLTPVPFPDGCTVEVTLLDDQGNPVPTVNPNNGAQRYTIVNDLSAAFEITDPAAFDRANREDDPEVAPSIPSQPVYALPFAHGYNQSLRKAMDADLAKLPAASDAPAPEAPTETEIRNMLSLAFWGGVRRVLPSGAVRALDRADWMEVGRTPDNSPVANQHGVCGLLFKIGGTNDLASLSNVRGIKIIIRHANWTKEVQDMKTRASLESIEAFFSRLPGFPRAPEDLRPTLAWNSDYAYRAYAVDDGAPFTHAKPAADDWFIRAAPRTQTRLKPLRRLYAARVRGDDSATLPDRLLLMPFLSFKVELKPYREYPSVKNTPGLWELVTAPDDVFRLAQFLQRHAAHDIIKRGVFFDKNGVPVSKAPELVGSYDLPWDAVRRGNTVPTILYYGDNDASAVILRLPVPDAGGSPRTVAAEKVMPGGYPSPFGDRWEVNLSAVEILDDFDALRCIADPANTAPRLPEMVVTAVWPGEVAFEFAQSVSSIEGNVKAEYVHPPEPASPSQVTPEGEYTHDLINYNALNVYLGWNEGKEKLKDVSNVEHFNRFSELYPIKKCDPGNGTLHHSFVFRSRPAASAPPDRAQAQAFFDRLYSVMPDGRRLGFNLEHTYGTRIEGGIEPLMAAHFDFPPLPASRVSRPKATKHSPLPEPSPYPFVRSLFYVDGGEEKLRLIFEKQWLLNMYAGDPLWGPVYVQAWRSVAELAFAKSIQLTAQCLVYDFTRGANVDSARLLDAFKEHEQFEGFAVDCTGPLQDLAKKYLGGFFPAQDYLDVTLTSGSQPRIANRCHVAEFALAIERSTDRLPQEPQSAIVPDPWKLWRFKTDVDADHLFDMDGQAVDPVTEDTDKRAFATWMASLRKATASFEPDARSGDVDRTALLRKLLAGDHDDNRQWIAPGAAVAGDGRDTFIAACPIGFRPLAVEPTILHGETTKLLSRYMQALAILLNCSSLDWANNWKTPAQWRAHFDLIQQQSALIVGVVQKSVDLLFPLPDSRSGMGIDPIVQQSVAAWKDPNTGVKDAFVAWSRSAMLQDPSLFVAAKALLYTRLWGKDGDPLANNFFRLRSLKVISEQKTDDAGKVFPAIFDDDTFTYREGLGSLARSRWFGFAEVLDDLRYDSQFSFKELTPTDVETFLERALANEKGNDPPKEQLMLSEIHVPGPDKNMVPLAARAPVTPPVPVFSGEIKAMIEDTSVVKLAVGQVYGRQAFLSGRLELASSGSSDVVQLVGRSDTIVGRRGQFMDDFVLSTIFAVRGDEEAEQGGWREAWDNDRFYLDVGMASTSVAGMASTTFAADVQGFFDRLAAAKNLSEMTGIEAAYDPTILNFVKAAMAPASTQTFSGSGRWYASLARGNSSTSMDVKVILDPMGTSPGAGDPLIEVFAFRPVDPSGPTGEQPHLYLLVNFLCKNWTPRRVAIEQTRNINVGFAPEFGSTAIGIGAAYQPFVSLDLYKDLAPVRLARRKYRIEELVELLLSQGILENLDEAAQHDLSLTVSHDQVVQATGEYLNASGDVVAVPIEPVRSALPVSQVIHLAGAWSGVEVDLTSFAYPTAVVDFQWSSKSNLQFFRLHSRRVILI